MSVTNVFFAAICWLCSLIFGAISLWAFKRKDPMHFWSGSTVRPEEITDIPAYNRANGLMWTVYAVCIAATGVVSLFSIAIGTVLLVIVSVLGLVVLIIAYKLIYDKYRSGLANSKTGNTTSTMPKGVTAVGVAVAGVVLILVGAMFFISEKKPVVNIHEGGIEIKAMYGINIDFYEIADISLIEKSMSEIGIGIRTNGYGGFGETLKGNFKSNKTGETLLFVQSKSSPTIWIQRDGNRDVYISFRDGEMTELIYDKMIAAIPLK